MSVQVERRFRRWSWLFAVHPQTGLLEVGATAWLVFDAGVPRWQLWRTLGGDLSVHLLLVHVTVALSRRVSEGQR